jgi:hypothetical protein
MSKMKQEIQAINAHAEHIREVHGELVEELKAMDDEQTMRELASDVPRLLRENVRLKREIRLLRELEAACRDTKCEAPYLGRAMTLKALDEFRAALKK